MTAVKQQISLFVALVIPWSTLFFTGSLPYLLSRHLSRFATLSSCQLRARGSVSIFLSTPLFDKNRLFIGHYFVNNDMISILLSSRHRCQMRLPGLKLTVIQKLGFQSKPGRCARVRPQRQRLGGRKQNSSLLLLNDLPVLEDSASASMGRIKPVQMLHNNVPLAWTGVK